MILLTDEEIQRVGYEQDYITKNVNAHDLCKAQLKKVVEWLQDTSMDAQTTIFQVSTEKWQALLEEVQ